MHHSLNWNSISEDRKQNATYTKYEFSNCLKYVFFLNEVSFNITGVSFTSAVYTCHIFTHVPLGECKEKAKQQ